MTRLQMYQQAIEQLEKAVAEFDQFRASLKDCGIDSIETGGGPYRVSDRQVMGHLEGLLKDLQTATCADCGVCIDRHDDAACGYQQWSGELPKPKGPFIV